MSSGSESDEEFVPGEPEKLSEEESADEETDMQFEQELVKKNKRQVPIEDKGKTKKRRTRNGIKDLANEPEEDKVETLPETEDPEEQKKKEEDLWARFLEGTDTKPKAASKQITATSDPVKPAGGNKPKTNLEKKDDDKARERRIFEFAGETIVVENNVIKEKIKATDSPASVSKLDGPSRSRIGAGSGGLSSVLNQLNKNNKLSTLEKSKLDWVTYKKEEGIEEEIQSHNKGKRGYLDRQDFLERADHRQYELERDLRTSRRSNR